MIYVSNWLKIHGVVSHLVISFAIFVDSIISEPSVLMQENLILDSFWMDWLGVPSSHFVGYEHPGFFSKKKSHPEESTTLTGSALGWLPWNGQFAFRCWCALLTFAWTSKEGPHHLISQCAPTTSTPDKKAECAQHVRWPKAEDRETKVCTFFFGWNLWSLRVRIFC